MLTDHVVVVTGGAGLLGEQFCRAIADQHGVAIVADVDLAAAARVAEAIVATGGRAEAERLDITSATSIDALIESLDGRYARIDALVNNAYPRNARYGRRLEEVAYADFCENLDMHLGGYFLAAQRFALYFRTRSAGSIVNIGSIYGSIAPRLEVYEGTPMTMPVEYAAIKAGVLHLTRYFAQYFKRDGVRCNSLSPGGILDGQPDAFVKKYSAYCGQRGMLQGNDVTGALIFLLSDASRHVTGQDLIVDDGFSL